MSSTSTSTSTPTPATLATIRLLAMASFLSGVSVRISDGLLPRLASDFSITPGQAGGVVITFSIAYGFMQLVFGPLGDRFGKARLICMALFGAGAAALACAFAPGLNGVLSFRAFWGAAAAGIMPLSMAWIGDAVPFEQRQASLARLLMGVLTGMMLGQLAGGLFADSGLGWRGAFFAMGLGYLGVAGLLLSRLRAISAVSTVHHGARFGTQMRTVLGDPWCRVMLALSMAEGVFLLGPLAYVPAVLHQRFGVTVTVASALVALYAVGGLLYAVYAKRIVARMGQVPMVVTGGVLMGVGFLGWLVSPLVWTAGPVAVLAGFGTYLFHNTLQTHATQMSPSARGTAVALFASCLFSGQAIGALLAGRAHDAFGPTLPMLVSAVALPVLGWAFAVGLKKRG